MGTRETPVPKNIIMTKTTMLRPVRKQHQYQGFNNNNKDKASAWNKEYNIESNSKIRNCIRKYNNEKTNKSNTCIKKNTAMRVTEAAVCRCFSEQVFLKISQYS